MDQKHISQREQKILHLIAQKYSSHEIADQLYLSYDTICTHRKNLLAKLDVRNTAGLIRIAFEAGILRLGKSQAV